MLRQRAENDRTGLKRLRFGTDIRLRQFFVTVKNIKSDIVCSQQFCRCDTADTGSDCLLLYSATYANRQSSVVTMEKTATTRVSDHPHSSK